MFNKQKLLIIIMLIFSPYILFAGLPRISVMALENKTGWRAYDIGNGMADMLVTALAKTKKFKVIERSELKKVLEEQNLGLSGAVTPQSAAKIGKLLGVQYIIIGSINEYGTKSSGVGLFGVGVKTHTAEVGLDIRVVDTTTAEVAASVSGHGSESTGAVEINNADIMPTDVHIGSPQFNTTLIGKATREAVDDAAEKVTEELGGKWEGAIMKVEGNVVLINGGENVEIEEGDVFKVLRRGEELTDPETGESLGSEEEVIGKIEVIKVLKKFSKAKIIEGSGFSKGDKVKKEKD